MTEETTSTVNKINTIIDTALDPVTRDFEEHYIPGVLKPEYELAKAKMRQLLEGYGGKDKIPEDVMPFYKAWSWKVYSYSKDRMIDNMEDMDKRKALHNLASKVLDIAMNEQKKLLTKSQITAFYTLMERGLIRGTENLELLARKDAEKFYNLCSLCERLLETEKNENLRILPIVVYPTPKCGCWFDQI
jgi:hypothetical protein